MSSIVSCTRRHRMVVFVGLAFAVSWWVWPFYAMGIAPTPFFACGPLVAALIVIGVTEGWSGYRTLGARMLRWRSGSSTRSTARWARSRAGARTRSRSCRSAGRRWPP